MQGKYVGYMLLSFLSFGIFTAVFHTAANAQVVGNETIEQPATVSAVKPISSPTPEIFYTLSIEAAPEPTSTPKLVRQKQVVWVPAPTDLEPLFEKYAGEFHVDKEDLKRIAKCEAGFNTNADTGTYAGMYQFAVATWISTRNAMGLDPNPELRKSAEEAIRTAAYKISNGGRGAWPNC